MRLRPRDRAAARKRLSEACFEHGPGAVARHVGVSRYTVWAWETGRHTIRYTNIPRIFDGVNRADLESEDD